MYSIFLICKYIVNETDGLLVVGSSLEVWSGFRFVREAFNLGKEVLILSF